MEKPTGLIKKIIDNLILINSLDSEYTLLDKDIILHNLRSAYMIFLNISANDESAKSSFSLDDYTDNHFKETAANLTIEIQKLTEEKQDLADTLAKIRLQLDETNSKNNELLALLASKEGLIQKNEIQNEEIQNRFESQTNEIQHFTQQVAQLHTENETLTNTVYCQKTEIEEQQKNIAHHLQTIDNLHKEIESLLEENKTPQIPIPIVEPVVTNMESEISEPEPIIPKETPEISKSEVNSNDNLLFDEEIKDTKILFEPSNFHPDTSQQTNSQESDDILEFISQPFMPEKDSVKKESQGKLLFDDEIPHEKPEKKSLNDLLCEQREERTVGSKFQTSHVKDLTKAISINDKFLFIRELFKNKGEEFSTAINQLNRCNNIEEAFELMETMKQHYFWDTTSQAYLTLCDLIRRRFV